MLSIELIMDPGQIAPAFDFFEASTQLLEILDSNSPETIEWELADLRMGSGCAAVRAPLGQTEAGELTLRQTVREFMLIRTGTDKTNFSPDGIKHAHTFARLVEPQNEKRTRATLRLVKSGEIEDEVHFDHDMCKSVLAIKPVERVFYGSVRGTLVGTSITRGNRATLRLQNKQICKVRFNSDLQDEIKSTLFQNVEIEGIIKKNAEDKPFHVSAVSIRELGAKPVDLWSKLYGIAPDFTGGKSIGKFLNDSRGSLNA